jgi:hypothetical protein
MTDKASPDVEAENILTVPLHGRHRLFVQDPRIQRLRDDQLLVENLGSFSVQFPEKRI